MYSKQIYTDKNYRVHETEIRRDSQIVENKQNKKQFKGEQKNHKTPSNNQN